jgi:hypothetical protein
MKLTVMESAASQAHKLYCIDIFRDASKIMFYIGRNRYPFEQSFFFTQRRSKLSNIIDHYHLTIIQKHH